MSSVEYLIAELTCGDDDRAETAANELALLGEKALPALQYLFTTDDPDHRWWALRSIAAIKTPQSTLILCDALHDGDQSVRQCAALGLCYQPDPNATPLLIQALRSEDHLYASLAADALIAVGDETVPYLLEVLQEGEPGTRLEAVRALAMIADPRAISALFSLLDSNSSLMAYWAEFGLERMGVGMIFFKSG